MDPSKALKFYSISDAYVDYLWDKDHGVQRNEKGKLRPYIGLLLEVEGHPYYAPLSSYKPKFGRSSPAFHKVYDDPSRDPVAVIKYNCMIPVLERELAYVDFKLQGDKKYQDLLEAEYRYIKAKQETILREAHKLYRLVVNGVSIFPKISCNFKLLESIYRDFK